MNKRVYIKVIVYFIAIFYIFLLISILLTGSRYGMSRKVEIRPFAYIAEYVNNDISFEILAGKLLFKFILFLPCGIIIPILFDDAKKSWVIFSGFCLSYVIEAAQFITNTGISCTDDIIMNTLGTAAGFSIFYMVSNKRNIFHKKMEDKYVSD